MRHAFMYWLFKNIDVYIYRYIHILYIYTILVIIYCRHDRRHHSQLRNSWLIYVLMRNINSATQSTNIINTIHKLSRGRLVQANNWRLKAIKFRQRKTLNLSIEQNIYLQILFYTRSWNHFFIDLQVHSAHLYGCNLIIYVYLSTYYICIYVYVHCSALKSGCESPLRPFQWRLY